MLPIGYLPIDNTLQITINQIRNDGSLGYSLTLRIDRNKHSQGGNLIDSLILAEIGINGLLAEDTIPPL